MKESYRRIPAVCIVSPVKDGLEQAPIGFASMFTSHLFLSGWKFALHPEKSPSLTPPTPHDQLLSNKLIATLRVKLLRVKHVNYFSRWSNAHKTEKISTFFYRLTIILQYTSKYFINSIWEHLTCLFLNLVLSHFDVLDLGQLIGLSNTKGV